MEQQQRVCRDFVSKGSCRFGVNCRFSHDVGPSAGPRQGPPPPGKQACPNLCNYGECQFGDKCYYSHDDKVLRAACLQQWVYHCQMTGESCPTPCKYYMEGNCIKGRDCEFWHPKWNWEEEYFEEDGEYYEGYSGAGGPGSHTTGDDGGHPEDIDEDEFLRDMQDFAEEEEERDLYGGLTYEECMIMAKMQTNDEATRKAAAAAAAEKDPSKAAAEAADDAASALGDLTLGKAAEPAGAS